MSVPPRTIAPNVQAILLTEYDVIQLPLIDAFIATASALVDICQSEDAASYNMMNSTLLELTERWLAAHFYQAGDPAYKSRNTSNASGQFAGDVNKTGFLATRFGQAACAMDLSGFLARRSKEVDEGSRRRVQVFVPQSDCYDADDGCCGTVGPDPYNPYEN